MRKDLARLTGSYCLALIVLCLSCPRPLSAQNAAAYWLANGNTTGATQTPLSLGNWASPATVPSFNISTWDNGTSYLNFNSTRWGTAIYFTRADPSDNMYYVAAIGGSNGSGGAVSLYNTSNQVTTVVNSQGASYFNGGNLLIGKTSQTNSGYLLDVNGSARANQVVVNTTGADFVFEPGYHLPALKTVEKYIESNRHLPGIAPAAEMQSHGVDLGEVQTRLLQKVEELTLYVIRQEKKQQAQQRRLHQLEWELKKQKARILQLQKRR